MSECSSVNKLLVRQKLLKLVDNMPPEQLANLIIRPDILRRSLHLLVQNSENSMIIELAAAWRPSLLKPRLPGTRALSPPPLLKRPSQMTAVVSPLPVRQGSPLPLPRAVSYSVVQPQSSRAASPSPMTAMQSDAEQKQHPPINESDNRSPDLSVIASLDNAEELLEAQQQEEDDENDKIREGDETVCDNCPLANSFLFSIRIVMHRIFEHPDKSWPSRLYGRALIVISVAFLICMILETINDWVDWIGWFIVDSVCAVFFTVDVIGRTLCCRVPLQYFFSVLNLLDLISLVPTYISWYGDWAVWISAARALRVIRIIRLLRSAHSAVACDRE